MNPCDVNGSNAHDIFKYLRANTKELTDHKHGPSKQVPYNFTKWLVDLEGKVIMYLDPSKKLLDYADYFKVLFNQGPKPILTKTEMKRKLEESIRALSERLDRAIVD